MTHQNKQSSFGRQGHLCPLQSPKAFRMNAEDKLLNHIKGVSIWQKG